jgi:[ribosomal protein S5]-alanine N-acetyltransferase
MKLDRPALSGPRLDLRTLDASHARGPYLGWMRDALVLRHLEARFATHDEASLARFIAACNDSADTLLLGLFLRAGGAPVGSADDSDHVGNIKLGPIDRHHGVAAIGILVGARDQWGKGLAQEAIGLLAGYAIETLGLGKLTAGCYATNPGSRRAFEHAGFAVEAVRRRHCRQDGAYVDVLELARFAPDRVPDRTPDRTPT